MERPFLMPIEDVFSLQGGGTVATGRIEQGVIRVGEAVEISPSIEGDDPIKSTVTAVERFGKMLDYGRADENVGLHLPDIKPKDIQRGQVVSKPSYLKVYQIFEAEIYMLTKDEGGRDAPFFSNYRTQFYIGTTSVDGTIELPEGVEMVMPGDFVSAVVKLKHVFPLEIEKRFALREGDRTIGVGTVSKFIS